jgi:DNA-binding NtrC family response regulator
VSYFLTQLAPGLGVAPMDIGAAALARFAAYDWPGNVRELKNLIERSLIMGYCADDFSAASPARTALSPPGETVGAVPPAPTLHAGEENLDAVERRHILAVLSSCGGNKTEAARRLGVSRKTLDRKCAAWGVV